MTMQFKPEPQRQSWNSHDSWAHGSPRSFRVSADTDRATITVSAFADEGCTSMHLTAADARTLAAEMIAAAESLAQAPVEAEQPA